VQQLPNATYRYKLTKADLVRAGVTAAGALEKNAGTFTWTITSDRWQSRQEGVSGQQRTDSGRYVVTRNGRACFADTPGRRLGCYSWRSSEMALQFSLPSFPRQLKSKLARAILRALFTAHPWRKVIVSPLIGVWDEQHTLEEYIAAGADTGEQNQPENLGHFVLTFRNDGRYSLLKTDTPKGKTEGTYHLKGGVVSLTGASDPGSIWPYSWSVYRDALVFRRVLPNRVDGTVREPTGFVVKPWQRVN
jgi:hypothetical protein